MSLDSTIYFEGQAHRDTEQKIGLSVVTLIDRLSLSSAEQTRPRQVGKQGQYQGFLYL